MASSELPEPVKDERAGLSPQVVVAAVLGVALAAFVVQNTDEVEVTWLFFDATAPLWLVLLVTAAAALVVAELVGSVIRRRRRKAKKA